PAVLLAKAPVRGTGRGDRHARGRRSPAARAPVGGRRPPHRGRLGGPAHRDMARPPAAPVLRGAQAPVEQGPPRGRDRQLARRRRARRPRARGGRCCRASTAWRTSSSPRRARRALLPCVDRVAYKLVAPAREEGAEAGVRFRVTFANAAARHAFGAQPGLDLLADGPLSDAPELRERLGEALARGTEVRLNASLPTRAGAGWFRVTATRFWGGLAVTFADISEHKETETRALVLAHTDPLTGLANRRGFEAEADRRLGEAEKAGRAVAMCYL